MTTSTLLKEQIKISSDTNDFNALWESVAEGRLSREKMDLLQAECIRELRVLQAELDVLINDLKARVRKFQKKQVRKDINR